MISPYLRRPLRSLEEMTTQQGRGAPAGKTLVPKGKSAASTQMRAGDSASSERETSITSDR